MGQQLMAVACPSSRPVPRPQDPCGNFLHYNPPNPLSSVFWPRAGYAPLWTLWEVRPARALR